ncbi:retrotransposon protein, putative, ty1-copia subclass, partial [Tanacetum coccineum]
MLVLHNHSSLLGDLIGLSREINKSHNVLGIALVTSIDRQLPFEYTIASRSTDVMVKLNVIEPPIPPASVIGSTNEAFEEWNKSYDVHNEVACLMLGSITPELHRQFENSSSYDMLQEFKSISYVLKMKVYVEQLEYLGYVLQKEISVGLILNSLTSDFVGFVRNYNKHNLGKTIGELLALLIEYEKGLPKKATTPQVLAIQGAINPKPPAKEHPVKDDACHHCKEAGHWKRNSPVYLAELMKKNKNVSTTSTSGLRGERKLKQGAVYLYVGNSIRAQVEAIGSFDLVLPNGLVIYYGISVSKNDVLYFNVIPCDGIYEIDMLNLMSNVN